MRSLVISLVAIVALSLHAYTGNNSSAALHGFTKLANRPIEFFGLAVDQDQTPIRGAKIIFQVRNMKKTVPGVIADVFDDATAFSDANELFSLTSTNGSVLTIKTEKENHYCPK